VESSGYITHYLQLADIAIVDEKGDLNIYIDMARDPQSKKRSASGSCEPPAVGLAYSPEAKSCCTKDNAAGACCFEANENTKGCCDASCCAEDISVEKFIDSGKQGPVAKEYNLSDININEWAGKFYSRLSA
jgi:hypothetical protein